MNVNTDIWEEWPQEEFEADEEEEGDVTLIPDDLWGELTTQCPAPLEEIETCAICLSPIEGSACKLNACQHMFCDPDTCESGGIRMAISRLRRCPICRCEIIPELEPPTIRRVDSDGYDTLFRFVYFNLMLQASGHPAAITSESLARRRALANAMNSTLHPADTPEPGQTPPPATASPTAAPPPAPAPTVQPHISDRMAARTPSRLLR